ncbi:MAG: YbjN domain-containing protein [Chloroflexota bacterium]
MSTAPRAASVAPDAVEAWLAELGLVPAERADREGITSWDLVLDGRRRASLRITLILDPSLALICWAHYAPPINDSFRRSYRKLLRWNDELPFVKFSIGEDERPLLVAEIPVALVDRESLGLALARQVAVADRFHAESVEWLKAGGWSTDPPPTASTDGPGLRLVARYAIDLAELLEPPGASSGGAPGVAGGAQGEDA